MYSGRKITASLGNVTVRGEKAGKGKGEARWRRVCLSMYSITENIYYSQLSSVAILLQPERNCFTSHNTRKGLGSLNVPSSYGLPLLPTCLLVTVNEARSYFASTKTSTNSFLPFLLSLILLVYNSTLFLQFSSPDLLIYKVFRLLVQG
jgi:hypothetical protein